MRTPRLALALVVTCAVAGALVRVAGAGLVCPDGLACLASPLPLSDPRLWLAGGHRLLAGAAALATVGAAVRQGRQTPIAAALAALAVLGQVLVGLFLEDSLLALGWGSVHLLLSLLATGSLVAMGWPRRLRSGIAHLPAVLMAVALVLASVAVGSEGVLACDGWPICGDDARAPFVDGMRFTMLAAFLAVAVVAMRQGRHAPAQLVLRIYGMVLGADLAVFATAGAPEFQVAQVALLHGAIAATWWLLPFSEWPAAERPATSPLPTSAPSHGAPTT